MNRYTETERRDYLRAFAGSGESAAAFCRRAGVSPASLSLWRNRYGPEFPSASRGQMRAAASAAATPVPPWLPVVLTDGGQMAAGGVGLHYYRMGLGDCRLEVPSGFAPAEVCQLWELLTGAGAMPSPSPSLLASPSPLPSASCRTLMSFAAPSTL